MEENLSLIFFGSLIQLLAIIMLGGDHIKLMGSAFEGDKQMTLKEGRLYAISGVMILICFVVGFALFLLGFVRALIYLDLFNFIT